MTNYDVIVIGGGPAGLGAALNLGRLRMSVLVTDSNEPRNAPASGVHGFLTRDGIAPAELSRLARADVGKYGVEVRTGRVVRAEPGFVVTLDDGTVEHARRLLVTTGLVDELPDIPGLRERWGRDVVHCPFCHGWEVRDRPIGVIATGPMAVHQTLLFRQLSADVVLFTDRTPAPDGEAAAQLAALGVDVIGGRIAAVETADDAITAVRLVDGRVVPREVLAVGARFAARSDVLTGLGVESAEHPSGAGHHVPAEPNGATSTPGVYVAGNVTDPMAQVQASAAAGAWTGAQIAVDLIAENARRAVESAAVPVT